MSEMRILTVKQPWAWAIIHGGKDVENRVRNIAGSYRGPVAIHAGLAFDDSSWDSETMGPRLITMLERGEEVEFTPGAILGVVDLVGVHDNPGCYYRDQQRLLDLYKNDREQFNKIPDAGAGGIIGRTRYCSPWALDEGATRFHLELANPRPLATPIPFKGALGLRKLPTEIAESILREVSR